MSTTNQPRATAAPNEQSCPRCGKANRAGLARCVICGTALRDEPERRVGEPRDDLSTPHPPPPRARRPADRPWLWPAAVTALAIAIGVLFWLHIREIDEPEAEIVAAPPVARPAPPPAPVARRAPPRAPQAPPAPHDPVARPGPRDAPPADVQVPGGPRAADLPRAVPPPATEPGVPTREEPPTVAPARETPPAAPPAAAGATFPRTAEQGDVGTTRPSAPPAAPIPPTAAPPPPRAESPAVRAAERAFAAAVEIHNRRVDEYHEIADQIHRRDAWDSTPESIALRQELDRARAAIESARAYAEEMRAALWRARRR